MHKTPDELDTYCVGNFLFLWWSLYIINVLTEVLTVLLAVITNIYYEIRSF